MIKSKVEERYGIFIWPFISDGVRERIYKKNVIVCNKIFSTQK